MCDEVFSWYRCYLRSAPGMGEHYDGHVDVLSPNETEVFERAVRHLARTSFQDRPSMASWRVDRIEAIQASTVGVA